MFLMTPFYSILFMGTLITLSSSSWFAAWLGLEINLMAFIPILYMNNKLATEAIIKYFLIQAISSSFILFFSLFLSLNFSSSSTIYFQTISMMILNISLFTKMGAAPFHFWFPSISEGLSWFSLMILSTWQKLAPLSLLMLNKLNQPLILIALISAMTGALSGLNQVSLKKIMVYSSISHIGWMILLLTISHSKTMFYFIFYSFLSITIMMLFNKLNMKFISQMYPLKISNILMYATLLAFLSMGGLPPLLGFFPKWMALNIMLYSNFLFISMVMVMLSIISLYYYIRISYSTSMLSLMSNKILFSMTPPTMMLVFTSLTIFFLPLLIVFL